jgi:hypothetical protein
MEDMIAVISHKFKHWGSDPERSQYVTPMTLFRQGNFDRYLNEINPKQRKAIGDGTILNVMNMYGKRSQITQEEFDSAANGFYTVIK